MLSYLLRLSLVHLRLTNKLCEFAFYLITTYGKRIMLNCYPKV